MKEKVNEYLNLWEELWQKCLTQINLFSSTPLEDFSLKESFKKKEEKDG